MRITPIQALVVTLVFLSGPTMMVAAADFSAANARFVEVKKNSVTDTELHIGEIEVFTFGIIPDEQDSDGTSQNDLVQAGSPSVETQHTTTLRHHGLESSVFDGDLEEGSAVWTTLNGLATEPRYMLDLGATYPIDLVRVWGRYDSCCQQRLEDFTVTLYADNGDVPGEIVSSVRYRSNAPPASEGPVQLSLAIFHPAIEYFTADHVLIPQNAPLDFSWKVNPDFISVSIDGGIGDVTAQTATDGTGHRLFTPGPDSDTIYTITVVRPTETILATLPITITDQPIILTFEADQSMVLPNSPVVLTWDVSNVTTIELNGVDVTGTTGTTVNPLVSKLYTLSATNPNGNTTVTRNVIVTIPGEPIISEFSADNDGSYLDEDLNASDWIELTNTTTLSANLDGYYLTDDPLNLTKWRLPNVTLDPNDFLVVFASSKDRAVADQELHTNFSLNAGGEYLALVKNDGVTIVFEFSPQFPNQKDAASYGFDPTTTQMGHFVDSTPGDPNGTNYAGFVKDTTFSVDRGFYDAPISVIISTQTVGAQIRYTLDGSEPTDSSGNIYTGPIAISSTTILRAAAFKANHIPSDIDTQTYIYRSDIITSDAMDTSITEDPTYGPLMEESLTSIPSISLVFAGDILRSEQECSMELIGFEGGNTQEDCGMARFGNYVTNFEKRNMRLYFRSDYGASKLNYPLFSGYEHGVQPVQKFDRLDLRSGGHDMWQRGFYMSNRFVDDTLLEMGHLSTHGRYVHVYVNGTYWGQYHLRERWDAAMHAEYQGGKKEDYEAIASNRGGGAYSTGTPYDGDGSAWENVKNLASSFYAVSPYLNITNYTDYLLVTLAGSAELEARAVGPVAAGSGFMFQMNDADGYLRNASDRTDAVLVGVDNTYGLLRAEGHPDFKMLIADRIYKHFFNEGVFTPDRNMNRLNEWGDVLEKSVIAEVARWNQMKIGETPDQYGFLTPDEWKTKKDAYIASQFPNLTTQVVDRFKRDGLYPLLDAPEYNHNGGVVSPGFGVFFTTTSGGAIYYTTDGSDPRLPGGSVNPSATILTGSGGPKTLLPIGSEWKYLDNGSNQGTAWKENGFNDSPWNSGNAQLGYGDGDETTTLSFGGNNDNKFITTYFRKTFSVTNAASLTGLTLSLMRDDGAIVYLNGQEIVRSNMAAGTANYDTLANVTVGGNDESAFTQYNIDPTILTEGINTIAVEIHQGAVDSSDVSFDLGLSATTGITAPDLTLISDTTLKARVLSNGTWSAIHPATFIVSQPPVMPQPGHLVISELHYHPKNPTIGELALITTLDDDDFEFIEIMNIHGSPVRLDDCRFTDGIDYVFPEDSILQPGARLIVAKDLSAFTLRHPSTPSSTISGSYSGSLKNSGEQIILTSTTDEVLIDLTYGDGTDLGLPGDTLWPNQPDGGGESLVMIHPSFGGEINDPLLWRASINNGGAPGQSDASSLPANPLQDLDADGASALLENTMGSSDADTSERPVVLNAVESIDTGTGTAQDYLTILFTRNSRIETYLQVETSTQLNTWLDNAVLMMRQIHPDGTETLKYRFPDPISAPHQFMRLRVTH